ncbi:hypothetical protein O1R50_09935 [Glycomyces luteolus]|uniref:Uncharacterized protein n=1 Tax=Glycomyces luteolus TaxID=2670330 RepID=A0A9X3PC95_9ACTN|nr:hypothetical protein [Glycomyces luteolus]MDA1359944.1 hypothetical protein [Glycomyces luteolus]
MSGECYSYFNGGIEYELRCDQCGTSFRCGDDSYFSWPVLCAAAEAEGWRVGPELEGRHECGECAGSHLARSGRRQFVPA